MARKKPSINFSFKEFLKNNLLLLSGLILIFSFVAWRYHRERILSFAFDGVTIENQASRNIKPIYVKAYPVGIDVSLQDSYIVDGVWQIHPNTGNYLANSAGIGDSGNMILYGHNKLSVFGPLRWIKNDAIIEITGSDNNVYKYKVVETKTVEPNDLSYVLPTDEHVLTIYTCTGFLDTKRFIVRANLTN